MSKLKNAVLAVAGLSMLTVMPASAQVYAQGSTQGKAPAGCKTGKFVGSYTHTDTFPDMWGDGSDISHELVFQLNLHGDGTAYQYWTGFPDLAPSLGTQSPYVGSWACRSDGKLVVTFITALYLPTTDAKNHPTTVPDPAPVDAVLWRHYRVTYLLSVTDGNTLTKIQSRSRYYEVTEDPSDPAGGTLNALNSTVVQYKRLVASDADLLAP
jgi:hypothetical protein